MKKKLLAILLTVCMVLSMAPTALAAGFGDTDSHWAESSIDRWASYGIIEGIGDGNFNPNGTMTRAQAAAIFTRLLKLDAKADISEFTDVDSNAWYADYLSKCVAAGIMEGVGNSKMDPNGTLTREQMMTMLCRALGIQPEADCDKEFTDSANVSDWAEGYVNALVNAGIVDGVGNNTMAPAADINRASMMALLDKGIVAYADEEGETVAVEEGKTGIVLIVADNVQVENAPVGTIVVTGAETTGSTVNGTEVDKDTVHEVEEEEKPSTPSIPSAPVTPPAPPTHRHDYKYTSNSDGTHDATCNGNVGTCNAKNIDNEACTFGADFECNKCGFDAQAKIGTTYYATLGEALAADGEIVLLGDIDLNNGGGVLNASGETIDLNGKTLTGNILATIKVNGGKFVTPEGYNQIVPVAESYGERDIYASDNGVFTMAVGMEGMSLTLESGFVTLAQNWYTLDGQSLIIKSGATFDIPDGMWFYVKNGTTATVEAGGNLTLGAGSSVILEAGASLTAASGLNVVGASANVAVTYADGTYTATDITGMEAMTGTTPYATLADAISAAQSGDIIVLLKDITASEIIVINKAITLDGNGKTLTSSAGRAINVNGADGVTIKNLTVVCSGERAINIIQNATNVTIENVTATAANYTVNVASSAEAAVVTIKNSTLNGLCVVNVAAKDADVSVIDSTVNCNDNNTTLGESYAALSLNNEAEGGKIIATTTTVNVAEGSDSMKGRNATVTGVVSINGSTAEVKTMVAAITYPGPYYHSFENLESAIAFAKNGDTVTLLRDVTLTEILVTDGKTIDLNGQTLSGNVIGTIKMNGGKFATVEDVAAGLRAYNMVAPADYTGGDFAYLSSDGVFTMTLRGTKIDLTFDSGAVALANNWQTDTNQVVTIASGASFTVPAGKTFLVQSGTNVVVNGTVTVDGTVAMQAGTTLKAPAALNVVGASANVAVTYADGTYTAVEAVAKIGNVGYATLTDAVAAADNDTITLLADITLTESLTIPASSTVILDLNGRTINGTKTAAAYSSLIHVENGGVLTVKDSSAVAPSTVGTGKITYAAGVAGAMGAAIMNEGSLILESGTLETTGTWSIGYAVDVRPNAWGTAYTNAASFVMDGGLVKTSDAAIRLNQNSSDDFAGYTVSFTMNDGEINSAATGIALQQATDKYDDLTVTINGGAITASTAPLRFQGDAVPTGLREGNTTGSSIIINGGNITPGTGSSYTWVVDGIIRFSSTSSTTLAQQLEYTNVTVSEAFAQANSGLAAGYKWAETEGGYKLAVDLS